MMGNVFENHKGLRVDRQRTICEVHRQIYDILVLNLSEENPELLKKITPLLEEVFIMGIKMAGKLIEYKCSLPNWERNSSVKEARRLREMRHNISEILRKEKRI